MSRDLSVVVTARNDGYGGDFLHRTQIFLDSLSALAAKHGLRAELIFVEWNPPPDRERLADALDWPASVGDPLVVRILEVPPALHQRMENADEMPLFEYVGKNVGIRRSEGEFVLATNPDVLFNEPLVERLADGGLSADAFYRINRFDVREDIPADASVEDRLAFCKEKAFKESTIYGKQPVSTFDCAKRAATYFPRHPRKFLFERREWPSRCVVQQINKLRQPSPTEDQLRRPTELDHVHGSASGDFLLMASDEWEEMRGYPELQTVLRIDYYGCVMAASMGLRQHRFRDPLRIYHQEHSRSARDDRPTTEYESFRRNSSKMLEEQRILPDLQNGPDWGLGEEQLPERAFGT